MTDETETPPIRVRNTSRSHHPQSLEGAGVLAYGEEGDAADTAHTRALIESGELVELPAPKGGKTADKKEDK
jgi:hypothetical protein